MEQAHCDVDPNKSAYLPPGKGADASNINCRAGDLNALNWLEDIRLQANRPALSISPSRSESSKTTT